MAIGGEKRRKDLFGRERWWFDNCIFGILRRACVSCLFFSVNLIAFCPSFNRGWFIWKERKKYFETENSPDSCEMMWSITLLLSVPYLTIYISEGSSVRVVFLTLQLTVCKRLTISLSSHTFKHHATLCYANYLSKAYLRSRPYTYLNLLNINKPQHNHLPNHFL